jgi:hypothetical protein
LQVETYVHTGKSLGDTTVALVVTGQLLPFEEAAPPQPAPEPDAARRRAAADALVGAGFGNAAGLEVWTATCTCI